MQRITLQQIRTDSDYPTFTPQGFLKVLAACAWGKNRELSPQILEQQGLISFWKEQAWNERIKQELNHISEPPVDYAVRAEVLDWLLWIEQAALASQTILMLEQAELQELQETLSIFLTEQEQHCKSRQDLWLYAQEAERAQKTLKLQVSPWSWITEKATIPTEVQIHPLPSLANRILSDWLMGELTPGQEEEINTLLEEYQGEGSLYSSYRELFVQSSQEISIPTPERYLALQGKLPELTEPIAQWRTPHYGRGVSICTFARDGGGVLRLPNGVKYTFSTQETLHWEDPLFGSLETRITPDYMDLTSCLEHAQAAVYQQTNKPLAEQEPNVLLAAAKLLKHENILDAGQRIITAKPEKNDRSLLEAVLRLRLELERAALNLSHSILECELANVDQEYNKKGMADAIEALEFEDYTDYLTQEALLPETWWGQALLWFQLENELPVLLANADIPESWRDMPTEEVQTETTLTSESLANVAPSEIGDESPAREEQTEATLSSKFILAQITEKWVNLTKDDQELLASPIELPKESLAIGKAEKSKGSRQLQWSGRQNTWDAYLTLPEKDENSSVTLSVISDTVSFVQACLMGVVQELQEKNGVFEAEYLIADLRQSKPQTQTQPIAQLVLIAADGSIDFGDVAKERKK